MKKEYCKNERGVIAAPIAVGVIVIIGAVLGAYWLVRPPVLDQPPPSTGTTTPTTNPKPTGPTFTFTQNGLSWQGLTPGAKSESVLAGKKAIQLVDISGQGLAVIKVTTKNSDALVTFSAQNEVSNAEVLKTTTKNPTGETVTIFQLAKYPNMAPIQNWQLTVDNSTNQSPVTYEVVVSESSTVSTNASTNANNTNQAGTSANLSLTVEETIALNVVVPVDNAEVTAIITNPNDVTTTVDLTEDPNNPGVYTGTFGDITVPGVYDVVYVISGENNAGEHFDQIVTDQFTVTPTDTDTDHGTTTYQSTKKFDINHGDEIQPVF